MNKIKLEIIFDPETSQVSVSGPIKDRILSFGLLEMAKIVIIEQGRPKPNAVPIIVPQLLPPNG